jgi:hypothetical protein
MRRVCHGFRSFRSVSHGIEIPETSLEFVKTLLINIERIRPHLTDVYDCGESRDYAGFIIAIDHTSKRIVSFEVHDMPIITFEESLATIEPSLRLELGQPNILPPHSSSVEESPPREEGVHQPQGPRSSEHRIRMPGYESFGKKAPSNYFSFADPLQPTLDSAVSLMLKRILSELNRMNDNAYRWGYGRKDCLRCTPCLEALTTLPRQLLISQVPAKEAAKRAASWRRPNPSKTQ